MSVYVQGALSLRWSRAISDSTHAGSRCGSRAGRIPGSKAAELAVEGSTGAVAAAATAVAAALTASASPLRATRTGDEWATTGDPPDTTAVAAARASASRRSAPL